VRKQFNTLVQKLEAERVKLALWRSELPKIHALADSEYRPLAQRFDVHRKQMLLALDRAYYDKTMGKRDKHKLVELICSTALDLMGCDENDNDVKAIYNTHSGGDFDLEMDQENAMMRKLVANLTGVELDEDADIGSPAAFFETMQKKMDARRRGCGTGRAGAPGCRGQAGQTERARGAPSGGGGQAQAIGARHFPQTCQCLAPGPRNRSWRAWSQDCADAAR